MTNKMPLNVYDDDTYIVGYPKSGNTWVRFLIGALYNANEVKLGSYDVRGVYNLKELANVKRPRILNSHQPFDPRYPKVIYIVRDPRDVVVSYYHFHRKFYFNHGFQKTFPTFVNEFVAGKVWPGSWGIHVRSWVRNRNKVKNGIIFVKYEDLLKYPTYETKRIMDFLNFSRTNEQIEEAVRQCSFQNLKQYEQKKAAKFFNKSNNNVSFFRKGASGEWRNVLTEREKNAIVAANSLQMKTMGYL